MPEFHYALSLSDLFNAFTIIITTSIALFVALRQLRQNQDTQRAIFLKDFYLGMWNDPDIRQAIYLIDSDKLDYQGGDFKNSPHEPLVDQLLVFVDLVCGLYNHKMLTEKEMSFFSFYLKMIYTNKKIQDYLQFLGSTGKEPMPFANFVLYCEKKSFNRLQVTQTVNTNADNTQKPLLTAQDM
jgi:hypothetical protein